MTLRTLIVGAALASALLGSAATANAATILIQGDVFFGATTAKTAYTAPGSQVQFSFDVTDPLNSNPTSEITDFSYLLNGVVVNVLPTAIEFFDTAQAGMFDIDLPGETISIYGADIGSSGSVGPSGFYSVTAGLNAGTATGNGGVTVGSVTGVPEPATWAMMLFGVGLIGAGMRSLRRKDAVALKAA
jgi:PEP-CTERM motif